MGVRPLYLAAANGNAPMIRLLVEAGADPNAPDAIGETMLMAAADSGDLAAVAQLLALGADANGRDPHFEQSALMVAARAGLTDIVRALIDAGSEVDARTRIDAEPDWILPNSRPGFSFGVGIIRGGLPADRGMRPFRHGGMTPLLYAARNGHTSAAELLLEAGADIDGSEANRIGPLLMAISNNRMTLATRLVERGAALDLQDWYGRSPLWSAVNVRNLYLHNNTFENYVDREPVLELIRVLARSRRRPQRAHEGVASGARASALDHGHARVGGFHGTDAVPHGGARRRRDGHATSARARRRSAHTDFPRHDAAHGRVRHQLGRLANLYRRSGSAARGRQALRGARPRRERRQLDGSYGRFMAPRIAAPTTSSSIS